MLAPEPCPRALAAHRARQSTAKAVALSQRCPASALSLRERARPSGSARPLGFLQVRFCQRIARESDLVALQATLADEPVGLLEGGDSRRRMAATETAQAEISVGDR